MTVSVCLKCGAMKHGAWTRCPGCNHSPEEIEDMARHLMTSDHYFSQADLEGFSSRVQTGQPLTFDPEQVEEFVQTIKTNNPEKNIGFYIVSFFVVVVALMVGAIYLIIRVFLK